MRGYVDFDRLTSETDAPGVRRSQLILPFRESRRLHDRAYRAQQDGHKEIVGLLYVT